MTTLTKNTDKMFIIEAKDAPCVKEYVYYTRKREYEADPTTDNFEKLLEAVEGWIDAI